MSNFSVKLDGDRPCRYVFGARLWDVRLNKFGGTVQVLLDTGSFNTVIHKDLVDKYSVMLKQTMKTRVSDFCGDANICVITKLKIGGYVLENVAALAVPFTGELKDHILLGTNVTNNWKLTLSRLENKLDATEQFSDVALKRMEPYRYCYDNKGRVMAVQEFMGE